MSDDDRCATCNDEREWHDSPSGHCNCEWFSAGDNDYVLCRCKAFEEPSPSDKDVYLA